MALDPAPSEAQTGGRPRRTGSLALFFRKVRAAQASVKTTNYSQLQTYFSPSLLSVYAGVSPGQCTSEGSVLEAGHLIRPAGEDLDML